MQFLLGMLLLFATGLTIGQCFFLRYRPFERFLFGLLTLLATISFLGSVVYYAWAFTTSVVVVFVLLMVVFVGWKRGVLVDALRTLRAPTTPRPSSGRRGIDDGTPPSFLRRGWGWLSFIFFITSLLTAFFILFSSATIDAVRSPWDVVPVSFFFFAGMSVLFGTLSIAADGSSYLRARLMSECAGRRALPARTRTNQQAASATEGGSWEGETEGFPPQVITIPLFLLFFSVAWILFPIGYGFDPFIHQAAERVIADVGVITPKSPYYIGQYTLVVFLAKLLGIGIAWMDKLLVPLLAALTIPTLLGAWIKKNKFSSLTLFCFFLAVPVVSLFIATTPQALGNLFLFVLILASLLRAPWWFCVLITLATLVVHPIAGIPAVLFLVLSWCADKQKKILLVPASILGLIAFPLTFLTASFILPHLALSFDPSRFMPWLASLSLFRIYRESRFDLPLDTIYFFGFNVVLVFVFFTVSGIIASITTPIPSLKRRGDVTVLTAIILSVNGILLNGFIALNFLISYEQTNYGNRLFALALLFLLPSFLAGCGWWIERITIRDAAWRYGLIVALTLGCTASLFLAYPQNVDRYAVSRSLNTSEADIDAVRWIDAHAHGDSYIVLANQSVSAAAIREFGFAHYYNRSYFYPIPTGSPLYALYLDMVYKAPSRETMERARSLVGVDHIYFVLNSYWTGFNAIKKTADAALVPLASVADHVFIYTTAEPTSF